MNETPRRRLGCLKIGLIVAAAFVGLIVLVGVIAAVAGGGGSSSSAGNGGTGSASGSSAPGSSAPGIGSPVRDGKFQFTVTSVSHAHRIGGSFLGQKAQGEFAILHVTVTNIGSEAQTLDDSSQYVFDSKGRKFSADSEADIVANNGNNSVFLQDINPGNTVRGKIAFDLPQGDSAVKAELHDSAFSGGVTVGLR